MLKFGPHDKIFDFRYFPPLLAMAQAEGASLPKLLSGTQIPESALSLENYKASVTQLETLIKNIVTAAPPAMMLKFGSQLNLSSFGIVGFAALSGPTARDVLYIAHRYIPIVLPLLDIGIQEQPGRTHVELSLTYPVEACVAQALFEVTLASMYTMASFVLQNKMPDLRLEVQIKLQDYHREFAERLQIELVGECQHNRIIAPSAVLNVPSPLANQAAFLSNVKKCDELLALLPTLDRSLSTGIQRRLLYQQSESTLTQEDIARELFMSVRTLHRLLSREGTTFREISNEANTLRARRLLEENKLSMSQIALELGYSDSANFTRAFRNQTGTTPSEYRRSISRS